MVKSWLPRSDTLKLLEKPLCIKMIQMGERSTVMWVKQQTEKDMQLST